jgi:hypothetical protein
MSGARHRRNGSRVEREIVALHLALGVKAERVPLSGASRYRDNGADVDIYALGPEECPLVCEVKSRRKGEGFTLIEKWLGDFDVLVLRRNNAPPLIVLPWRVWACLVERVRR